MFLSACFGPFIFSLNSKIIAQLVESRRNESTNETKWNEENQEQNSEEEKTINQRHFPLVHSFSNHSFNIWIFSLGTIFLQWLFNNQPTNWTEITVRANTKKKRNLGKFACYLFIFFLFAGTQFIFFNLQFFPQSKNIIHSKQFLSKTVSFIFFLH